MPNSPSPEPDEPASNETQTADSQPPLTVHPLTYSSMPMHMYPFPSGIVPNPPTRSKRRQVKNACTNCQKACKKCDDARPCLRCVKYGIAEECVDSHRKERKKGVKRGPYKKRDGKRMSFSITFSTSSPSHSIFSGSAIRWPTPAVNPDGHGDTRGILSHTVH